MAAAQHAGYVLAMPRYPVVLFDLDGTLINSVRLILDSYHHAMRALGLPPRADEEWLRGLGTPLRVQFAEYEDGTGRMERLIAAYREYNLAHHDAAITVYDGVVPVVRALGGAGRRLALVTSKNRAGAERGLRLAGLDALFGVIVGADDVAQPKPHPEPVLRALDQLGARAGEAIFVGDSVHDMHAGRAAGVATAAVLWGPFDRATLAPSAPDHWLAQPADLLALLEVSGATP